jgi:hypothetical protein
MNETNRGGPPPPPAAAASGGPRRRRHSKARLLFTLLVILALTAFVYLNWSAFADPTTLSLGLARVEAPLGLILIGLLVVISLPLMAYAGYLRRSALLQAGRLLQEIQAQRNLADNAETSRFTELRRRLDECMQEIARRDEALLKDVMARIDGLEAALRSGTYPRSLEGAAGKPGPEIPSKDPN